MSRQKVGQPCLICASCAFLWLHYVTETDANLLARTRLRAPISVGSGPRVDAMMRVDGKPRQIVASTLL